MSTKTQVQATIDAIADGELNTALEARTAWQIIADELYTAPIKEQSSGVKTITNNTNANISYEIVFRKVGNVVFVNGNIKNTSGSAISNQTAFNITNSVYYARTGFDAMITGDTATRLSASGNVFYILNSIAAGAFFYFNASYITND